MADYGREVTEGVNLTLNLLIAPSGKNILLLDRGGDLQRVGSGL